MRGVRSATIVVLIALSSACATHDGSRDPVIGTWDLDISKSSFDPGPPLKSQTRIYEQTPAGVKFTLTGLSAERAPMRVEYTAAYDGKDYPLKGSPSVNTVALRHLDRLTAEALEKKDGEIRFRVSRVLTADENTMVVTSIGTNARGVAIKNVLVFRRR